jgi:tRNA(Ser,Leu) C12 N-acetylase TAN1
MALRVPDFNLIVVHEPGIENYGRVRNYVKQVLGEKVVYAYSYQSVILYRCFDDPHLCAETIRRNVAGTGIPLIKAIPVDAVVNADVDSVRAAVRSLTAKMQPNETFRITLQGHLYKLEQGYTVRLSSSDAVKEVAKEVDRPVNLTHPDWVIYVRVLRIGLAEVAAVSLLKPDELERVTYEA